MNAERKIYFLYNLHRYEIEFYALLEGPADADIDALEDEFYARYGLEFLVSGKYDHERYLVGKQRMMEDAKERGWIDPERSMVQEEYLFLEWLKAEKGFVPADPRRAVMKEFSKR